MDACRACGARLFAGASFCGQCHAPVTPSGEEVAGLLTEVDAAAGRWHSPPSPAPAWRPPERLVAPPPPTVRSRWRGDVLHFGPAGRIAITLACVLGLAYLFFNSPSPGSSIVLAPFLAYVIRLAWHPARIRVEPPPRREEPRAPDGV